MDILMVILNTHTANYRSYPIIYDNTLSIVLKVILKAAITEMYLWIPLGTRHRSLGN
jgi:uncharacterized protein with PQ loop repeat